MKNKLALLFVCVMLLFSSITILANANSMKISDDNNPPNPPEIVGPTSGKIGTLYTYRITMSDPDVYDGLLRLEVTFGDGIITILPGCCGKVWENPTTINVTHKWENSGNYNITGRVMDTYGNWSAWSDPLPITMPCSYKPIPPFLELLFQRFPHAFPILRQPLGY
jgi:hypothetical protein